jgi:hypothetical protein
MAEADRFSQLKYFERVKKLGRSSVATLLSLPQVLLMWALLSFVLSVILFVFRALPASIPAMPASTQPSDITAAGVAATRWVIGALMLLLLIGGTIVFLMLWRLWGDRVKRTEVLPNPGGGWDPGAFEMWLPNQTVGQGYEHYQPHPGIPQEYESYQPQPWIQQKNRAYGWSAAPPSQATAFGPPMGGYPDSPNR